MFARRKCKQWSPYWLDYALDRLPAAQKTHWNSIVQQCAALQRASEGISAGAEPCRNRPTAAASVFAGHMGIPASPIATDWNKTTFQIRTSAVTGT